MTPRLAILASLALRLAYFDVNAQELTDSSVVALNSLSNPGSSIVEQSASKREAKLFDWETEQVTDAVIAKLATLDPLYAELFSPAEHAGSKGSKVRRAPECKAFPGDPSWPGPLAWTALNVLSGGRLLQTTPLAAPCYKEWPAQYNPAKCEEITRAWGTPQLHVNDASSTQWPLFQGLTCLPPSLRAGGNCTLGGYASYSLNASSVAQIQLAINFARWADLRLVVKNTGHDFADKSIGAGALSIWTHHLDDLVFLKNYTYGGYSGAAFKLGAGVRTEDIYRRAESEGVTVVGGLCRTVGIAGGYAAGGGHSPVMGLWGMAADQILSFEVVKPDGRFVTASANENPDLYWALRGGGGSTFGVVTSLVIKAYSAITVSTMTLSYSMSSNLTATTFWAAFRAHVSHYLPWIDAGTYSYFFLLPTGPGTFSFALSPFFAPNMTVSQLQTLVAPWLAELAALGIPVEPVFTEYSNFRPAWEASWLPENVGSWTGRAASRLFPRSNFATPEALDTTVQAVRYAAQKGGLIIGTHTRAAPNAGQDNAVNSAWRETATHFILAGGWDAEASYEQIAEVSRNMTVDWMKPWREASPGAGAYMSEADINEPEWQKSFFGKNYERLYALKQEIDPWSVFYAPQAVGSENWEVTGQRVWVPTQEGRLCRKG